MIEITREIDGAYDFELDRPRSSPLQYDATWPSEGEAPGLVLIIPGFGADADPAYGASLRRHVLASTGMAAVSVRYHAIQSRPANGAEVKLDPEEHVYLIGLATLHNVPVGDGSLDTLARNLAAAKVTATANAWLEPARGEYQNFGVVQAMDHLAVIGDLIENAPAFDTRRIVAMGSSHGGYIAHLLAKIAPSTLAAIIDNSSYVQAPLNFMGLCEEPEFAVDHMSLRIDMRVRSGWTIGDRAAPNFYGRDQDLIRDLAHPPHVARMRAAADDAGTQYFMVNAAVDLISPPDAKRRQERVLQRAGFAAELSVIGPDGIDGRVFKTMTHGLDCSLKGLFDRYVGQVRPRQARPDTVLGSQVAYDGVDRGYRFTHAATAPYVRGETYALFDVGEDPAVAAVA